MDVSRSFLLIDNSNSRTKFRLCSQGIIGSEQRVIPTRELSPANLRLLLTGWIFSEVYVSSVVPHAAVILSDYFSCPIYFLQVQDNLPVDFSSYSGSKTLGADRVSNVIGTLHWNRFPLVAVDLGTAITYDVVIKDAASGIIQYAGGVISPGLSLFSDYLSGKTALLHPIMNRLDKLPRFVGQNTEQAMQYGMVSGAKGMIRTILADIVSSLNEEPFIIATGGDAQWAAGLISEIDVVDPLLTFRGLVGFAEK